MQPLDLLSNTSLEQDIIRCLVRTPQLTLIKIAQLTERQATEIEELLKQMLKRGQLTTERVDDELTYSANLGRRQRKPDQTGSLLDSLFD